MKRQVFAALLACVLFFSVIPVQAFAAEDVYDDGEVIHFEDGSYLTITLEESLARASSTKTGYKKYTYKDSDGVVLWVATLTASFTYTGATSTCTSAACTVTISDSNWYEKSNTTSRSGNTATTELIMGKKFLGIPFTTFSYTITLTCDANGNLS